MVSESVAEPHGAYMEKTKQGQLVVFMLAVVTSRIPKPARNGLELFSGDWTSACGNCSWLQP